MRLLLASVGLGPDPRALPGLIGNAGSRKVAVVLNAADTRSASARARSDERLIATIRDVGLEPVVLDLRRFFDVAIDERAFAGIGAVCLKGGSIFVLTRALRQSGADKVLSRLLTQDEVVWAGYSAGACVLSDEIDVYSDHDDNLDTLPPGYERTPRGNSGLSILPFWLAPHCGDDPAIPPPVYARRLAELNRPHISFHDNESIVWDGIRYTRYEGDDRYPLDGYAPPRPWIEPQSRRA